MAYRAILACAFAASLAFAAPARANTIALLTTTNAPGTAADTTLDNYYNANGFTSSQVSGTVTASMLSGVDLFIVGVPDHSFTAAEITAMLNFDQAGGLLVFFGNFGFPANVINSTLAALGSNMSLQIGSSLGGTYTDATGSHILSDPLTAGVNDFNYNAGFTVPVLFSGVSGFGGLTGADHVLMTGPAGTRAVAAYDSTLAGGILLLGTATWADNFAGVNDNDVFFNDIATVGLGEDGGPEDVPEPTSLLLLGTGLAMAWRKRQAL